MEQSQPVTELLYVAPLIIQEETNAVNQSFDQRARLIGQQLLFMDEQLGGIDLHPGSDAPNTPGVNFFSR